MPSSRTVLVLALSIGAFLPGVARADSSCDALFARLREAGYPSPDKNHVRVLWTTNYYPPSGNLRFMGITSLLMNTEPGGDMTAYGIRERRRPLLKGGLFKDSEEVSIRIRSDGQIFFNEQYGPFDPICTGDRFARVDSGDSIEVFGMKAVPYVP